MDKGYIGALTAGGFQHIECTYSVGVKVLKWNFCPFIMRGLSSSMHYGCWLDIFYKPDDPVSVAISTSWCA